MEEILACGEETAEAPEPKEREEGDMPTMLRHRSLRRQIDNAYEACYPEHNWSAGVGGWFRSLLGLT